MTAVYDDDVLARAVVRIRSGAGNVVGAGFLVDADVVCTCAHVVAAAAGLSETPDAAPSAPVRLDFPLLRDQDTGALRTARATVVAWRRINDDDTGDVALLRLDRPVEGSRPVPLVDGTRVWEHRFRTLGFPAQAPHGVWTLGTLRGPQGAGWLQMETAAGEPRISPGFSGSPVWDDEQRGVVGMTVAAERAAGATTAYLIPSASLMDERVLRPRCPFRGLAAFTEADAELFHGREEETRRLREAVAGQPLTLVVGPSGSGKSSLVRAGLLPRLTADGMTVSELRALPGTAPEAALARALVPVLEPGLGEVGGLRAAADLAGLLSEESAGELRARLLAHAGPGGHVLFVDQLEEYAGARPEDARTLLRLLAALVANQPPTSGPPPASVLPPGGSRLGFGGAVARGVASTGQVFRVVATARPESLDSLVTSDTADLLSRGATQFLAPLAAAGLHQAVTGPVETVPGLWFEAGLPERIVADAADEPGRMPLVEFALTRLWEQRDRSMLTHAAYDRLGGVAGALVGYAEEALRTRLADGEEYLARRLFAQTVRPADGGGFARRPARTADLDPALRDLAHRLGPTKLLVLGRGPDGAETVELAHEALATLWPRLGRWLAESRDFRDWQEHLRRDLQRWQGQGRETGALLRGGILATASDWLERRPEDIPEGERAYIRQSERHLRRGARRWRTVATFLTVLTLLATGLAVAVQRRGEDVKAQLRTSASRLLADLSHRHEAGELSLSLQFAMAAWRTGHTAEAYGALLRQYPRGQQLTASHTGLWSGRFLGMRTTPDGRTSVVRTSGPTGKQTFTVVTGLREKRPLHRELRDVPPAVAYQNHSALSPDGHSYALAGADGTVWVWDLTSDGSPRVLPSSDGTGRQKIGSILDFSSDGRRLLRLLRFFDASGAAGEHDRHAVLSAWELSTGQRLDTPRDLVPGEPRDVAFTADSGQVVFTSQYAPPQTGQTVIRELLTGRQVHAFESNADLAVIAGGGELVAESRRPQPLGDLAERVFPATAAPGPGLTLPTPAQGVTTLGDRTDASGEYAVFRQSPYRGKGYEELTLIALRTGKAYRTRTPALNEDMQLAVIPGEDGRVTVLVPAADSLVTATAAPVAQVTRVGQPTDDSNGSLSPDGTLLARVDATSLEVVTAADGTTRKAPRDAARGNPTRPVWTADSQWVVVERGRDSELVAYRAADPAQRVELAWEAGDPSAKRGAEAFEPVGGSEIAVLTRDGRLLLVDAATGRQVGPPVRTVPKSEPEKANPIPSYGQLRARPGHPDEIAVTGGGTGTGTVEIWNVRTRTRLHTLAVGATLKTRFEAGDPTPLVFRPDGNRLVTLHTDGFLRQWEVPGGDPAGRVMAAGDTDITELVGFGVDNTLIAYGRNREMQFWDLGSGLLLVSHPVPVDRGFTVRGEQLLIVGEGWYQDLDLRPQEMMKTLCAAAGRDYTPAERALLPPGTPAGPPCEGLPG
ncbi:trypsin-like peptidase domain-containing protein [Streptomyces sp. NBC_01565]|uniref:nSTAND1 domain-containing NTPase n=1 Tax=Streptomyces sp. NBC_01565 TaxID=2975881 RepID=UPI00224D63BF|nr:trypsin-like peptidase domain-containing protein [Streptomyces sp. NBC_01565]MCX4545933.1 trypsin-like peptidase domain-containing protein [Streptomyces sp. NBC_01565]